jgi:uncharacterized protein (DUF2236 family)
MHGWQRGAPGAARADVEERDEDREVHERCVAYLRGAAAGDVPGLYGPSSVTWEIWREPTTLAGGLPAVLCQLAHPAIAAGVSAFSNFRDAPVRRARNTMTSLYALVFGDLDDALGTCRALYARHRRVEGVVPEGRRAGDPYRALDPALLRWVAVSSARCGLHAFETFVRPLTPEERSRWVGEAHLAAVASGVAPDALARDVEGYEATWLADLHGDALEVTPTARALARALLSSAVTRGSLDDVLAAGLLPEALRDAYELPWGNAQRRAFATIVGAVRLGHRVVPRPLRSVVAWHQAHLRLARAEGRPGTLQARVLDALDRRVDLPTSLRPTAPQPPRR